MWLEVKAMFTGISIIFIGIVLSQILLLNFFLGFLLFITMFLYIFGDIVLGWQITRTHANRYIDKPPPNKELIPMFTITGLMDFVWADKKPHGKREFVFHKEEASLIDKGDYPIHFLNGAHGCIGLESCDENLNLFEAKYAEKIAEETGTDNIKEIYAIAKKEDENAKQ